MNKIYKRSQDLSKAIFDREVGAVTPLNFCQRQAARRARNLYLSRLRTVGISKEAEDAPDASNRNLLVHRSAITAIDIDSQEWRYVLAGTSDGSLYIHDIVNFSGIPRHNANLITAIKGSDGHRERNRRYNVQYIGTSAIQQSGRRASSNRLRHKEPGGHSKMVSTVQWFPEDSGMFITSGMDGAVKMWDANVLESGPVEEFHFPHEQIFSHHLRVTETNSSSKKSALTLLAVASESNHINLLDLKSGSSSHELRGHTSAVMTVRWSIHSDYILASGDRDGHLLLWDVRRAKNCLRHFDFNCISRKSDNEPDLNPGKRKNLETLKGEPHKRCKHSNDKNSNLHKFEAINTSSKLTACSASSIPIAHNGAVNGLLFCDDGKSLISFGCHDGRTRKWDISSGINKKIKFPKLPPNKNAPNMCMKIDHTSGIVPGPDLIFVPSEDSVVVFDSADGERVQTLNGHFSNVNCCVFNPTEQELFTGGSDRNILIWEPNISQTDAYLDHMKFTNIENGNAISSNDMPFNDVIRDNWSSSEEDTEEDV